MTSVVSGDLLGNKRMLRFTINLRVMKTATYPKQAVL